MTAGANPIGATDRLTLPSLSRSRFQAPSGPHSAFWPLDCGPARANLDLPSPSILTQAGKFMAVGVLNTLIDAATYFMLTRWTFLSALPVWAKGISYVVGMVNSFFWNRTWTFRSRSNPWRAAGLFTLTHVAALGINAGTMALGLDVLHLPEVVALGLATGASFAWNFTLNKWVVFR